MKKWAIKWALAAVMIFGGGIFFGADCWGDTTTYYISGKRTNNLGQSETIRTASFQTQTTSDGAIWYSLGDTTEVNGSKYIDLSEIEGASPGDTINVTVGGTCEVSVKLADDGETTSKNITSALKNSNCMDVTMEVYGNGQVALGTDQITITLDDEPVKTETLSSDPENGGGTDPQDPDDEDDEDDGDPCWNANLDSMSWILCPAENNLESTASVLDEMIDSWLQVDTSFYNSTSPTYTVWKVMCNIANAAMIIIMLAVIFSQLTGVGIDNYGIKKILPKLILVAVLVNLSYVICQIVIDLSNILGVGLRNLFYNLGNSIRANSNISWGESVIGTIITAMFAAAGIGGAASGIAVTAVTAGASGAGPMVVIMIIIALLTIIVAVLMFFLALGARMLIIIICVAVAPVAFVLYALPNTKKLFDRWWKMLESALVIYPICGALGGVSYLLKYMVLTIDGVHLWMLVVALIAPFLVFFLLPGLLKKSIEGLGSIGGALVHMSGAFKSGTKAGAQTIQNTEAYKTRMNMGSARINRAIAGLDENNNPTARGERRANRANSETGRRRGDDRILAHRIAMANKDTKESEEAATQLINTMSRTGIANAGGAYQYYENLFKEASRAGDTTRMDAALAAAVSSGYLKDKDIAKIVRNAENDGDINIGDPAMRGAWMRDTASKYGNGFLGSDYELKRWMQQDGAGALGGYGEFASRGINMEDISHEDVTRMSTESIIGMMRSGKLGQDVAERALASKSNMTSEKRVLLGAYCSGNLTSGDIVSDADIARVKSEAEELASNASAGNWGTTSDQVTSWTAPPAQSVNIVQDFNSSVRKGQANPVDVSVKDGSTNARNGSNWRDHNEDVGD